MPSYSETSLSINDQILFDGHELEPYTNASHDRPAGLIVETNFNPGTNTLTIRVFGRAFPASHLLAEKTLFVGATLKTENTE